MVDSLNEFDIIQFQCQNPYLGQLKPCPILLFLGRKRHPQ